MLPKSYVPTACSRCLVWHAVHLCEQVARCQLGRLAGSGVLHAACDTSVCVGCEEKPLVVGSAEFRWFFLSQQKLALPVIIEVGLGARVPDPPPG